MSGFDDLAKSLIKSGIENVESSEPSLFLSTGYPPLDHCINGRYKENCGLPIGRIVEIFGPPSAGKTFIATQIMISTQNSGGIPIFMDHERSFDSRLAEKLGLDIEFPKFIYQKPRSFEQSLDSAIDMIHKIRKEDVIPAEAPITIIFDSLAEMIPESKLDKNHSEYNMHDNMALAKATSASMPAFSAICEENNVLAVFLNHMKTKPGVTYGDPTTSPGGDGFKFKCSVRIKLSSAKAKGDDDARLIKCDVIKNKVWVPFKKAEWKIVFDDSGITRPDIVDGCIKELCDIGILRQDGAWITWTDGKKYNPKPLKQKIEEEDLVEELLGLFPLGERET